MKLFSPKKAIKPHLFYIRTADLGGTEMCIQETQFSRLRVYKLDSKTKLNTVKDLVERL